MTLQWTKCSGNEWCRLEALNLDTIGNTTGVYAIWHGGQATKWVRIGQGIIKQRLSAHRNDPAILAYKQNTLYVTWASVPAHQLDGVEAYLAQQCNPLVGERFPDRTPIPVNLPK